MKILSLKLDRTELNLNPKEKEMADSEIITRIIMNSLITYSQQTRGLLKEERKVIYNLDDKFKQCTKEKKESIELEDKELGFIRKVFRETKLDPSNILRKVEDLIDNISTD